MVIPLVVLTELEAKRQSSRARLGRSPRRCARSRRSASANGAHRHGRHPINEQRRHDPQSSSTTFASRLDARGVPRRLQRRAHPECRQATWPRITASRRCSSPATCRCDCEPRSSASTPTSTAPSSPPTRAGPASSSFEDGEASRDRPALRRRRAQARRGPRRAGPHRVLSHQPVSQSAIGRMHHRPADPTPVDHVPVRGPWAQRRAAHGARPARRPRPSASSASVDRPVPARACWPSPRHSSRCSSGAGPGEGPRLPSSLFAVGGQDLGYLPGDEAEKMSPWAAAVYDALGAICSA